jgi:peptide deformylase
MIITDEKILRTKCEDAAPEEVGEIISLLEKELNYSAHLGRAGIGLAAIQCGIPKNIAIVRIDQTYKVDLVNCKISHSYDEFIFENEGCLSVPNKTGSVKRYNEIHITDNLVYPNDFIAAGLFSVVIQHELDHTNSILFTDKIIQPKLKNKPNELCLCGSGRKYKKCCQKR